MGSARAKAFACQQDQIGPFSRRPIDNDIFLCSACALAKEGCCICTGENLTYTGCNITDTPGSPSPAGTVQPSYPDTAHELRRPQQP